MQNSTGLRPYKIRFINEIFYPLYQKKLKEENEQESTIVVQRQLLSAQNKITALPGTITNEVCDYYNLQNPKSPINSDNLRKTYLNELAYVGWIESVDVRNGNTKKVYYPIVIPPETSTLDVKSKTQETNETKDSKKQDLSGLWRRYGAMSHADAYYALPAKRPVAAVAQSWVLA